MCDEGTLLYRGTGSGQWSQMPLPNGDEAISGTRLSLDGATGAVFVTDEVPYVFEELYRGQNARGVSGSGLGLALVQCIVELHEGGVSARSREGRGPS